MLYANQIADFLKRYPGTAKIPKLSAAIHGCGIEDYVIMNVSPIRTSCYDKGIPSFCESQGQFISKSVGILHFPKNMQKTARDL